MRKNHRNIATATVAMIGAAIGVGACGDAVSLDQAASALLGHYATHPPARDWQVETVIPESKSGKLVVEVMVTDETDIHQIKALSRMEQFTIAKLACPKMTPELHAAIGPDARVWVRLKSPKEDLTSSICPE